MPGDIFRVGREEKTISAKVITAFDEQKLEHKLRSIGASGKEQPGRQLRVLGRQRRGRRLCHSGAISRAARGCTRMSSSTVTP